MTDVCSGAGMEVKPGVNSSIVVTPQYLQSLLPAALAALYPYIPFMRALEIGDVSAFCAAGPPTWSVPTAEDFLQFLSGGNIGNALLVQDFMEKVMRAYLWYNLCQCSDASAPDSTTPPTLPDLPGVNPPTAVTPPTSQGCQVNESTQHAADENGGSRVNLLGQGNALFPLVYIPMPVGVTRLDYQITQTPAGTGHDSMQTRIVVRRTGGADVGTFPVTTSGATVTGSFPSFPANATGFYVDTSGENVGSHTDLMQAKITLYCAGGLPGSSVTPCCPPDPFAEGMLKQILDAVTLIQRQAVPFSRIDGASHAGLTGQGSLSVQGLLGARLVVTTIPARAGRLGSDPEFLYDLGSISWGSPDGHSPREVIHTSPQLSMPRLAGQYTTLTYSLLPGVVLTVVEMVREP